MSGIFEYASGIMSRKRTYKGKTADFTVPLPAGARPTGFYIFNNSANAITGGIRIGSAAAGTQYLTAQAVAASSMYFAVPTLVVPVSQSAITLYVEAVTAWNSADIDFVVEYDELLSATTVPGAH